VASPTSERIKLALELIKAQVTPVPPKALVSLRSTSMPPLFLRVARTRYAAVPEASSTKQPGRAVRPPHVQRVAGGGGADADVAAAAHRERVVRSAPARVKGTVPFSTSGDGELGRRGVGLQRQSWG